MVRFYTPNLDEACDALDDSLYDDALDAFDEYDIEYEEV